MGFLCLYAFVLWLVLCHVVGRTAERKGEGYWAWTILAFLISPLLAILVAAVLHPNRERLGQAQCRSCLEWVPRTATTCKFCGQGRIPVADRGSSSTLRGSPMVRVCPKCSAVMSAAAAFCTDCGCSPGAVSAP